MEMPLNSDPSALAFVNGYQEELRRNMNEQYLEVPGNAAEEKFISDLKPKPLTQLLTDSAFALERSKNSRAFDAQMAPFVALFCICLARECLGATDKLLNNVRAAVLDAANRAATFLCRAKVEGWFPQSEKAKNFVALAEGLVPVLDPDNQTWAWRRPLGTPLANETEPQSKDREALVPSDIRGLMGIEDPHAATLKLASLFLKKSPLFAAGLAALRTNLVTFFWNYSLSAIPAKCEEMLVKLRNSTNTHTSELLSMFPADKPHAASPSLYDMFYNQVTDVYVSAQSEVMSAQRRGEH
jgi:hypothetical protein